MASSRLSHSSCFQLIAGGRTILDLPFEAMMATFQQAAKETPETGTQAEAPRILAADDQPHILDAIELLLQPEGYRVERAQSPREVRDRVASETYDALLIDLNYTRDTTSGAEGLELLAQLSAHDTRLRLTARRP